jgi:hypothetical protein
MSSATKNTTKYVIHDNKCYQKHETELLDFYSEVEVPEETPVTRWKGHKLPVEIMRQCVAFCRWSSKKFSGEGLIWFFYDEKTGWSAWAPPQETNGMTVSLNETHPDFKNQRAKYKGIHFGTLHDHHHSGAFQSGTDHDDEIHVEGIHITLGNTDKKKLSIHTRASIGGSTEQKFLYKDWFELPDWYNNIPESIEDIDDHLMNEAFKEAFLTFKPKKPEDYFPKEWQKNIKKKLFQSTSPAFLQDSTIQQEMQEICPTGAGSNIKNEYISAREQKYIKKIHDFIVSRKYKGNYDFVYYASIAEDPAESNLDGFGLAELGYDDDEILEIEAVKTWIFKNPSPYPRHYTPSDYALYLCDLKNEYS